MLTDFHDTHAPGFDGEVLRYEIGHDGSCWWWRRGDAWVGPCDSYEAALDCVLAVEAAAEAS